MINQGLKMLKRVIGERSKGGMQTDILQIQLREYDMLRVAAELEGAQKRITELEAQLKELREVTPRMLKSAQLGSELGVIATSKYAGAYDIMTEMYQVMFDAAIKG